MPAMPFRKAIMATAAIVAIASLAACTASSGGATGAAGSPEVAAQPLEGTLWTLTEAVGPEGNAVPVPAAVSATATFTAGTVSGNSGCNQYSATYVLDGDKLTIGPAVSTKKACGPAETLVETAFLAALERVATYAIDGDSLTLSTSEGKVGLSFTPTEAATLTGTPWVATGVNNGNDGFESIATGTTLTAAFADGQVAGSGGCNQFTGPYTSDDTTIKIGPLAATLKLCNEPAGVDEQEAAYLAALQNATTWSITGDTLELRDDGGALQVAYTPSD